MKIKPAMMINRYAATLFFGQFLLQILFLGLGAKSLVETTLMTTAVMVLLPFYSPGARQYYTRAFA
jgi:hypothetical protein